MNLRQTFNNIVPNPFSDKSTLSDLEKKISLIKGSFNIFSIFLRLVVLFIIAFILKNYFNVPILAIYILLGVEVFITLIKVYFYFKAIKAINIVGTKDSGLSYRRILIINEYYTTIQSGITFIASFIGICLLFFLVYNKILNLNNIIILANEINLLVIGCVLLFFITLRLLAFVTFYIRYRLIKKIPEGIKFEKVNQNYNLILAKVNIVKLSILVGVVLIIFTLIYFSDVLRIPLNIILIGFAFIFSALFLALIFNIFSYQRLRRVNFVNNDILLGEDGGPSAKNINLSPKYRDEEVLATIFGINRAMARFKDVFKKETRVISSSFLGVGKTSCPENSILITNHRLLFLQLPVTGGDKVIENITYIVRNFLFNRAEIMEKGEELLETDSFEKILELTRYDIFYKDIKSFILTRFSIKIKTFDGHSFAYFFIDKKYRELLNKILPQYLKGKYESK